MGIKIWNMEPQRVIFSTSISDATMTVTTSTFDVSKPYIIQNTDDLEIAPWYVKNSTPVTIIVNVYDSHELTETEELSPNEQVRINSHQEGLIRIKAKIPTNTIGVGITAT